MSINKKFGLIFLVLVALPTKAIAFIDFCFPISITILVFLLGWPQMILYEFGYKTSSNLLDLNFILLGILANLVVIFIIGMLADVWRKAKNYLPKKYYLKLPTLLLAVILLLFALSFVDKTCA